MKNFKKALVLGAGGFIGSHLVKKLKNNDFWVRGVDLKYPEFSNTECDEFIIGDLRNLEFVSKIMNCANDSFDEVYQLAADMGGAGYVFTGENDANIMYNSSQINLNVVQMSLKNKIKKIFYSSSACVYNNLDENEPICKESSAYPANPDNEYGWEKIFSERLFTSFNKNYGLNIRISRFHTIFGTDGIYDGGKEKAPYAICRKVINCEDGGNVKIWGDGKQTRSFLYIDDCLNAVMKLMDSDYLQPINIGSEEMISINDLTKMIIDISGKKIEIINIDGPDGVRGRNSDNNLFRKEIGEWKQESLKIGIEKLYKWILQDMIKNKKII